MLDRAPVRPGFEPLSHSCLGKPVPDLGGSRQSWPLLTQAGGEQRVITDGQATPEAPAQSRCKTHAWLAEMPAQGVERPRAGPREVGRGPGSALPFPDMEGRREGKRL